VPPRTGATLEARRHNADAGEKANTPTGNARAANAQTGCQRKGQNTLARHAQQTPPRKYQRKNKKPKRQRLRRKVKNPTPASQTKNP
jgi:hypothetical protein